MQLKEDHRDIATIVVLHGGRDASGNDVVATATNEEAAETYGRRGIVRAESQWTTLAFCQLRAQHLLAQYSKPERMVVLDAEPELVSLGDQVTFTSDSIGISDVFIVQGITFQHSSEEEERMIVELTNRNVNLADFVVQLMKNMERR